MANLMKQPDLLRKLEILSDSAKYDVACTSSGVERKGAAGSLGNSVAAGLCHSFAGDGRCISLLKVLYTNECVYDCKYCVNRCSRDVERTSFTPQELSELTIQFYRRNYIEGLFLSSGVTHNPTYTMEKIYETLYLLRNYYRFNGYIHIKSIPGADPAIVEKIGWLADRMSTNLELPTADGLKKLAPQKTRKNILTPIRQIQMGRQANMDYHGIPRNQQMIAQSVPAIKPLAPSTPLLTEQSAIGFSEQNSLLLSIQTKEETLQIQNSIQDASVATLSDLKRMGTRFVPAGQSTQMIIGATEETDFEIVHVAEALYHNFDLKRVFYSAFINTTNDPILPATPDGPPLLREHRLYQADFLLRFYGFRADEIITAEHPTLNIHIDPKCNWALNHIDQFPVEIQTANYHTLLRVPGIGTKSAQRIIAARRTARLRFQDLKKIGVVLKRAQYFIQCNGHSMIPLRLNSGFILSNLLGLRERLPAYVRNEPVYEQLSLLDSEGILG